MKHILYLIVGALLVYHSVYFEPLEEKQEEIASQQYDAQKVAREFWNTTLLSSLETAAPVTELLRLFEHDMETAVNKYGNTLGVSSVHSYLIRGEGTVTANLEKGVLVSVQPPGDSAEVLIATRDIYGNAVRDASGHLSVSDFNSTMRFNEIASALNSIVRDSIVPGIQKNARVGKTISFVGAAEISENSPDIDPLQVIPIKVSF